VYTKQQKELIFLVKNDSLPYVELSILPMDILIHKSTKMSSYYLQGGKEMTKKSKIFSLLAIALVFALVVAGCGGAKPAPAEQGSSDVIKIGVFEPLTGDNAAGGQMTLEGMELANKLYPEVLGKKVELVVVDNKSDRAEAANAVSRLIDNDKVSVILGSYSSGLSMAGGQIAKDKGVPVIGCSPTNPLVTLDNDYYFRVCFIDPFQGAVMANYAINELGITKAAIIKENGSDYSVGLARFFYNAFTEAGGEIVADIDYQKGDNDFTAQLGSINSANPEVIFAPGDFGPSALLIKQAREMGIEVPFLGGDTWEVGEFLELGGAEVEGATFSSHFTADAPATEMTQTFLDAFKAEYPEQNPNAFAALGFDTYILALDAMTRAESAEPAAIKDALAQTADFVGATGMITLDANGDATKSAVVNQVVDGAFTFKMIIEPK
jgi:branched-chain amino acid transport system substrate-binding protein